MKTLLVVIGLLMLSGCYGYHSVVPEHDIPAGSIIEASDLLDRRGRVWTLLLRDDYATDPSQVIGHRALNPIHAGSHIHLADLSPIVETAK